MAALPPLPVIVVSRDPLARGGLVGLLRSFPQLDVVHDGGPEDLDAVDLRDVVLAWDLGLGDGSGELRWESAPTLVLATDADQARVALEAGARGALSRAVSPGRLHAALLGVAEGLLVLDPSFEDALLPDAPAEVRDPDHLLTPREAEVLPLLAEGLSNKDIALALAISEHTARFHVQALLSKMDAATRTEAVVRAIRWGVLEV